MAVVAAAGRKSQPQLQNWSFHMLSKEPLWEIKRVRRPSQTIWTTACTGESWGCQMPCQPFPKGAPLQSVCMRLLACSSCQGSSDTDHKVGPLPSAAPTTSASTLQLTQVSQVVPLSMHILSFFCYLMNFGIKHRRIYNLIWNGSF